MATKPQAYGPELADVGPVLYVSDDRSGARFEMEVGYWGIVVRLPPGDVRRLIDQLQEMLR